MIKPKFYYMQQNFFSEKKKHAIYLLEMIGKIKNNINKEIEKKQKNHDKIRQ